MSETITIEKPSIPDALRTLRASFAARRTRPLPFRRAQLRALLRFLAEHEPRLVAALRLDLQKPRHEALLAELHVLRNDALHSLYALERWARPERPPARWLNALDAVEVRREPYGVALIVAPWNYPLLLLLGPLINAIAAGNCAVLKPAELAPHTAQLLVDRLPEYLDPACYCVVSGGLEVTGELLRERFDYIFFTGSSRVGRLVLQAAAPFLTPCTLELGGKSPVYLDGSADIYQATRRILWGRMLNAGQTCVSPDYLLCTAEVQASFVATAKRVLDEFYGGKTTDLSRIVNEKAFLRLAELTAPYTVAIGGEFDAKTLKISPTIITGVKVDDPIMGEEIFGPILPIVVVGGELEAVEVINARAKPLALYVFTRSSATKRLFVERTSSGGVVVNDTIMHLAVEDLPFGGVGESGMGAYHGRVGFETFSHKKSVLVKRFGWLEEWTMAARYPPYTDFKSGFIGAVMLKRRTWISWDCMKRMALFGLGVGVGYATQYLLE